MKKLIILCLGLVTSFAFIHSDINAQEKHMGDTKKAYFAGGCFWCMEPPFQKLEGVLSVLAGYAGGSEVNPSYEEVAYGQTTHREAIEIAYDPAKVSYSELLKVFWRNIDPTQTDGQFADKGEHYKTAIFYQDEEEKKIAETSKEELANSGLFKAPIVTEILPHTAFYPAEDHHQDYYLKNPTHYKLYSWGSGRGPFLKKTWNEKDE